MPFYAVQMNLVSCITGWGVFTSLVCNNYVLWAVIFYFSKGSGYHSIIDLSLCYVLASYPCTEGGSTWCPLFAHVCIYWVLTTCLGKGVCLRDVLITGGRVPQCRHATMWRWYLVFAAFANCRLLRPTAFLCSFMEVFGKNFPTESQAYWASYMWLTSSTVCPSVSAEV